MCAVSFVFPLLFVWFFFLFPLKFFFFLCPYLIQPVTVISFIVILIFFVGYLDVWMVVVFKSNHRYSIEITQYKPPPKQKKKCIHKLHHSTWGNKIKEKEKKHFFFFKNIIIFISVPLGKNEKCYFSIFFVVLFFQKFTRLVLFQLLFIFFFSFTSMIVSVAITIISLFFRSFYLATQLHRWSILLIC